MVAFPNPECPICCTDLGSIPPGRHGLVVNCPQCGKVLLACRHGMAVDVQEVMTQIDPQFADGEFKIISEEHAKKILAVLKEVSRSFQ